MERVVQYWNRTENFITGLIGFLTVSLVLYAIVMRYVFHAAPEWVEELVIYLVVWAVYLAASGLAAEQKHVGATFVVDLMPAKIRRWIDVGTTVLGMLFFALIAYYGYTIVSFSVMSGEVSESSLRFPMWVAYAAVPMGMVLLFVRYLRQLWLLIFKHSSGNFESGLSGHGPQYSCSVAEDLKGKTV